MPSLLDLRRTASALVAVAMSAALIAFAFIISDSARTQMQTNARLSVGDAAIVVQDGRGANSTEKALDDDLLNRVSASTASTPPEVTHWDMLWLALPKQLSGTTGTHIVVQDVPTLSPVHHLEQRPASHRLRRGRHQHDAGRTAGLEHWRHHSAQNHIRQRP